MKLEEIGFYTLEDNRAKNASQYSRLWRCELLLTNKCNFKCPYCRGTDNDANINFEQAKKVVDLWKKYDIKNVRFSGGEPTLIEWLPDLISYCNGIDRIAISTNGSADFKLYEDLYKRGVNDFSISLDACCSSYADKMAGRKGYFDIISNNIRELSKLTYVTVGCVFNQDNVDNFIDTVKYAHELGVADIRIITAAQYNEIIDTINMIPENIVNSHPILKYRVNNYKKGKNVRGISKTDNNKCPLILDDMAIRGNYHYPCIIKMREGCAPIGSLDGNVRLDRYNYYKKHDCYKDNICKNNCLDVCTDYNNKWRRYGNKKCI